VRFGELVRNCFHGSGSMIGVKDHRAKQTTEIYGGHWRRGLIAEWADATKLAASGSGVDLTSGN